MKIKKIKKIIKIKNEMPLDNLKKEIKEIKEIKKIKDIKPIDSHKKAGIIYKTKNILNNNKNNKEKINNNIYNPISEAITKKIVEYTKQKKNRNFSVKNSNNLRNRKKNNEEDDINNKGHLLKTANYKNKIEQNKNLKVINNKKENKEEYKGKSTEELLQVQKSKLNQQSEQIAEITQDAKKGTVLAKNLQHKFQEQTKKINQVNEDMDILDNRMNKLSDRFEKYIDKSSGCCIMFFFFLEAIIFGVLIWVYTCVEYHQWTC